MDPHDERERLSAAERQAFTLLPQEATPPADLEERTVALLRRAGHLPTPLAARRGAVTGARTAWWISGAVAAGLALFASGIAVGQYLGTRNAEQLVRATGRESATELAAHVQRAGVLYTTALAALSQLPDSGNAAARDSVRHVALQVLGRAAQEMALIAPDDPLAAAVLRGLNQRSRDDGPTAPSRSVVWY